MKILTFAASNHKASINKQLVQYAANRFKETMMQEATIELIDLIDYELPLFRQDREADDGIPEQAKDFFARIGAADAIIVSFAEHNGLYNAAYKNLFDWASRIDQKVYQEKPMVLMATSPGGRGGANVLKTAVESAPHFGMDVKGSVSVPKFQENFDSEAGELTNAELVAKVDEVLSCLLMT